jgi:hypothetical protein
MSLWAPFQAAGGIVVPWWLATGGEANPYPHTEDPTITARAILLHAPGAHLGAVDPDQVVREQAEQWQELATELLRPCARCAEADWPSWPAETTPLIADPYFGFFDRVPAARELETDG